MVTNNKRRREGGPPRRHRQLQGMWSCWHEGDKKREQGLALLKKAEEILASKNNRAKIVATRAQCATTHKMHICRESNNSRIQSKAKTQRESTRMHRAKAAQSCAAQKGANPPKRKVSEQSKDAVREQQYAPHKCSNEYVATKKQVAKDMPARFPPKTRYKLATRRATSVPQDALRACHKTRYECATRRATSMQHDALHARNRHALCTKMHYAVRESGALHDTGELQGSSRHGRVTRRSSRHGGVSKRSSRHGRVTKRSSRYGGVHKRSSRYGRVNKRSSRYGGVTTHSRYGGGTRSLLRVSTAKFSG
jgi:hypothetical protein